MQWNKIYKIKKISIEKNPYLRFCKLFIYIIGFSENNMKVSYLIKLLI